MKPIFRRKCRIHFLLNIHIRKASWSSVKWNVWKSGFYRFEGHMRMVLASKIGSASQYFHFFSKGVLWDMDEPITARDVHAHITEKCLFQALLFCKKWRTYFGLKCRIRHKPASEKPILLCIKFNRRVNCNWFLKMNNLFTEISHFLWKHF